MSTRGAAAVIAGLVLLVGVILGFAISPTLSDPVLGTIHCGSAFSSSTDAESSDLGAGLANVSTDFVGECSSKLAGPRIAAWVLIGVGGLGLLFVGLTVKGTRPAPKQEGIVDDHTPA